MFLGESLIWLFIIIIIGLTFPFFLEKPSWKSILFALIKIFFGVFLPIVIFFASMIFSPEWKGEAHYGWLSSFHFGKIALAPLIFWASAALYAFDIWPERQKEQWVAFGIFLGAIVSALCFFHGVITLKLTDLLSIGLIVPFYVAIWYVTRSLQFIKSKLIDRIYFLYAFLFSLPFWITSIVISHKNYNNLPETPPDCFVVTAASKGHTSFVGAFFQKIQFGKIRNGNAQLHTFWEFEAWWIEKYPKSYQFFRSIYNIWGYRVAKLVRNAWLADVAFLFLKPVEIMAKWILEFTPKSPAQSNAE